MTKDIIRELPAALISWYDFKPNAKALYITGANPVFEVLFDVLNEKNLKVTKVNTDEIYGLVQEFDYIVFAHALESVKDIAKFLEKLHALLASDGILLMGVDNRLAIRYFCGDKDLFTGHVLDGIDNYIKVSNERLEKVGGHSYAKFEIENMLAAAGFTNKKFYSVMPTLERPQILLRDGYVPNEALDIRVFPQYKSPSTVYLEEERLYDSLLKNNMLHQMSNGYLIECAIDGKLSEYDQVTVQGDRSHEEALATLIKANELVYKKPMHEEAKDKIKNLIKNNQYLKAHGVPVVDAKIENEIYKMPYIDGEIATLHLRNVLRENKEKFLDEILKWKEMIESSSEHVACEEVNWLEFEPGWESRKADDPNLHKWEKLANGSKEDKADIGVILKHGFIELVSLNCFYTDDGYKFFDQEFAIDNFPANAILLRTIDIVYGNCGDTEKIYPKEELLKKLHLYTHETVWRRKADDFINSLRNENKLRIYHKQKRRDYQTVTSNRYRMDYPQEEYEHLFTNIFKGADNKQIYLFGSGRYSEKFIDEFGQYFKIAGVLDNDSTKWETDFHGVKISAPSILKEEKLPYKVFICIKFFEDVLTQLQEMEVKDISIYDPRLDYERPKQIIIKNSDEDKKKPYHIGYVAGVFDLFHKGHLNILRRAKEQCDYLIVGVVSDEQVIANKKTAPYIPFEERREIVEACRYVDEAVKIPMEHSDTEDAWRMYHFDAQFSGSDYENDPAWLAKKEFLNQHGSDLIFFPYTESTSSTKIKDKIRKI